MRARSRSLVAVAGVAVGAVLLRAVVFAATELYSDEAYYWLWSLRLAPGYFDHPPAIAWLVRGGTALAGGELGVRLLSLVCGGLTIFFTGLLARELSDDPRAPLWGALLALSAPMLHLAGGLALPDAPLVAAYAAAVWLLARARGPRWIAMGVAVGVALLSKYTAALLAPALLLLVIWDEELRRDLGSRWPWLGAGMALLVFAPCLAWNAQHDWVSLGFQLHHGFGRNATWGSFQEFVAGQLLGAGPVVLVLAAPFLARPRSSPARRVAAAALVPLGVMLLSAARGKVEANWPALVYPVLAAAAAAQAVRTVRVGRIAVAAGTALSVALLAAFGLLQHRSGLLVGTPVIERLQGWRETAREVRRATDRACRELRCDGRQPFVVPVNYQYAGELAFYGGFRRLGPAPERSSQLDLWDERPAPGEAFFLVGFEGMNPAYRGALGAGAERPTSRLPIWFRGHVLRTVTVTPYTPDAVGARER